MIKKMVGLIISVCLLAGCSNPNQQTQRTDKRDIIQIPSSILLKIDHKKINIPLTNYKIINRTSNGTTKVSDPNDLATRTNKFVTPSYRTLAANSLVKIEPNIPKHPKIEGSYFDNQSKKQTAIKLMSKSFKVPDKKGQYDYRIHTIWHNCDATYTFLVKIK